MNIFPELPTAFPWYDRLEKQDRFKPNVSEKYQTFGLIAPRNALLPFEFWKIGAAAVTNWHIFNLEGNIVATIAAGSLALVRTVSREGRHYFYYAGETLSTGAGSLNLPEGFYYSRLTFSDAQIYYSEVFQVPACSFLNSDVSTPFIKLEWYNDTDIAPIFFNDKDGQGVPYFRNVIYLDSFIHVSEPEIIEDTTPDGTDEGVATFQKAIIRRRVTELLPDFLKLALGIMQMHDHVFITTPNGLYSGEIQRLTVASAPEFGGAFSTVDIIFEEDLAMIKKSCGDNMV